MTAIGMAVIAAVIVVGVGGVSIVAGIILNTRGM